MTSWCNILEARQFYGAWQEEKSEEGGEGNPYLNNGELIQHLGTIHFVETLVHLHEIDSGDKELVLNEAFAHEEQRRYGSWQVRARDGWVCQDIVRRLVHLIPLGDGADIEQVARVLMKGARFHLHGITKGTSVG